MSFIMYNMSMNKSKKQISLNNFLKVLFAFSVSFSFVSFVTAQQTQNVNSNFIYSPRTQNLNVVDSLALNIYCSLSKAISPAKREKCFVSNQSQNTNQNLSQPNSNNQNFDILNKNLENQAREIQELKNAQVSQAEELNKKLVESNKNSKPLNSVAGNTIIRYVTDPNFSKIGRYNTVVGQNSFAIGSYNTITREASNSVVIGSNIINTTAGSVQIGTNNKTKLFIGRDGFVSVANGSSSLATTSVSGEQLNVAGKVRASGLDVYSAYDISDTFPADEADILAGHIVQFSGTSYPWNGYELNGIIKATNPKKIIGVVSARPAINLGVETKGLPVASAGRAPVKVSDENGKVLRGDRVTLSATKPGLGAKLISAGQSVGIALSDANAEGNVLILVKSEYINNPEFYK